MISWKDLLEELMLISLSTDWVIEVNRVVYLEVFSWHATPVTAAHIR